MPGKIKNLIQQIIRQKSGGNPALANVIATKLILKGINPDKFNDTSTDDPTVIARVNHVATEMGVTLR